MKPTTIHIIADQLGVPWDDNESFMDMCEAVTAKRHLDDMDPSELRMVADALRGGMYRTGALVGTDTASLLALAPEMLLKLLDAGDNAFVESLRSGDHERIESMVRSHGGAWFNVGRDGMHEVTTPDAVHEGGAEQPYGTERFAAINPTGIQWLANSIFPSFLRGFLGHWLLTKLFEKLKTTKMLPSKFFGWLTRRVPTKMLERTSAVHRLQVALPNIETVLAVLDGLDCEGDAQKEAALISARLVFAGLHSLPTREDFIVCGSVASYLPTADRKRIASQRTVRGPYAGKRMPRGISEPGKAVWRGVLEEFEKQIKHLGGSDPLRRWTAAVLTYQRVCKAKKIDPWQPGVRPLGGKTDGKSKRKRLLKKASIMADKGLRRMTKLEDLLSKKFDLDWDDDFEWEEPAYVSSRDEFAFSVVSRVDANRTVRAAVRQFLGSKGFVNGSGVMVYNGKQGYRILVRFTATNIKFTISLPFRSGDAMLLTKERDRSRLLPAFRAYGKRWWAGTHDTFK